MFRTKEMLLERSRILDSAHAKPETVSGKRRIKSTSSNFWKRKPFLAHQTILVEKSAFKHKMVSKKKKKSAFSSNETVKSARLGYRDFD